MALKEYYNKNVKDKYHTQYYIHNGMRRGYSKDNKHAMYIINYINEEYEHLYKNGKYRLKYILFLGKLKKIWKVV